MEEAALMFFFCLFFRCNTQIVFMAFIFIYKLRKVYNYDQLTVSSKKKKKALVGPGVGGPYWCDRLCSGNKFIKAEG